MGFADTARARRLVTALGLDDETASGADTTLLQALAAAADPDLALAALARMAPDAELRQALRADAVLRDRLVSVLGASAALGDHLIRHQADWRLLADSAPFPAPDESRDGSGWLQAGAADAAGPVTRLRVAYRRRLLRLAGGDLAGEYALDDVMAGLADAASAALETALAIARAELPADAAACRLAVIAMGKCGARELNYSSDVDVIFVAGSAEPARLRSATRLASRVIRICSQTAPEGQLFPVDPNLRPEGRAGPLVRTVASHLAYYERWASTWEFQALLKARFVAGDAELAAEYLAAITPLVWQAAERDGFVADVQAMRRRVVASLPAEQAGRELKLGPGGLRDIEFAIQLLQLVHGRADESLRLPGTLPALAALAAGGYVGRADAAAMAAAYRFLRGV
ncbi:MAG: bifunctional [glutamine synthetase] adenylyltransferase/[glutamine synthetase]-adenylyl-L-tyrosine phosphorylase, partial [Streptosporangiaceae bacterium]